MKRKLEKDSQTFLNGMWYTFHINTPETVSIDVGDSIDKEYYLVVIDKHSTVPQYMFPRYFENKRPEHRLPYHTPSVVLENDLFYIPDDLRLRMVLGLPLVP